MRIVGLDLGKKRIGVAVSDGLGITAQPVCTIKRKSYNADIEAILAVVAEYAAERIVVGLPVNMDGTQGASCEFVLDFVERIRQRTDIEVVTWDERLSTAAVTRVLIEGDVSREGRKEVVDKLAAAYILQGYLDSLSCNE